MCISSLHKATNFANGVELHTVLKELIVDNSHLEINCFSVQLFLVGSNLIWVYSLHYLLRPMVYGTLGYFS